ncbi:MAG: glucose-6-phosphate dehydrogenase [Calditrichaeota bacterium]|nr:MAG: glucose-6-phosphate dehydrogenase [Calditrichota bacterium]
MTHTTPKHVQPITLVIFGASGDLTRRKLIPALYVLYKQKLLPPALKIVGTARRPLSDEAFRQQMEEGIRAFSRIKPQPGEPELKAFLSLLYYIALPGGEGDYRQLREKLDSLYAAEASETLPDSRLYYLATPPEAFWPIISNLGKAGLITPVDDPQRWTRVIIEKPFGRDLQSARELNQKIHTVLDERQVFRIDHYLGKETVQNIMAFRFGNSIFEPLWNRRYVDHVQITVAEKVPVGRRAGYYDKAGALRDMVQNHLMQLLALTAMEPPASFQDKAVRDEKVKVLKALQIMTPEQVAKFTVRGQYTAGVIDGQPVPAYQDEPGVAKGSRTETYVALKLFVDNWRWSGVPFYLRTGKALKMRLSEINIVYTRPPLALFKHEWHHGHVEGDQILPNRLTLRIQPDEGIRLRFGLKVPGPEMILHPQEMEFCYSKVFNAEPPEAYERLILDAILGDSTLFIRQDEVEASWEFVDAIIAAWQEQLDLPIHPYAPGSWGPEAADRLMERDGRHWIPEDQHSGQNEPRKG